MTELSRDKQHAARKGIWLLTGLLLLTGCGFQLKGSDSSDSGLSGVAVRLISSQPRAELTREVTRELSASGAVLADSNTARVSLTIQPEQFTQRNVSLTAQARAAELELTLSASFILQQSGRDPIDATANVSRQMLNDPRNVVGKTEELRLLRAEMRQDLAAQIVRRASRSLPD